MSDPRFLQDGFDKQLAHAIEECGEFLAAAGKTQRWGRDSVNPLLPIDQQETNEKWLKREANDVADAIARLLATIRSEEGRPMAEDQLKPCPKCHGVNLNYFQPCTDGGFGVICHDCHLSVDTRAETKEGAAAAWNRRAPAVSAERPGRNIEAIADDLRILSNDMANAKVPESLWRPVYERALMLEALDHSAPVKADTAGEGWAMRPREPTEAMYAAARGYLVADSETNLWAAWTAMYDAVPATPEGPKEQGSSQGLGQDQCADAGPSPRSLMTEHALALEIIEALTDEDPCRLDHNGDCQAHAAFGEGDCPHAMAKAWLERNRTCEHCGDQTIRVGPGGHIDCIACNPPLGMS